MKKLLNTLYVTSESSYLSLDGENVVILDQNTEVGRIPLHNLEAIVSFGYRGVSPALMGGCAERNISLSFMTPHGKFLARITGGVKGNVTLRKKQYAVSQLPGESLKVARNCILGKVYNARWVLERAVRAHSKQIDGVKMKHAADKMKKSLTLIQKCDNIDRSEVMKERRPVLTLAFLNNWCCSRKKISFFRGGINVLLWTTRMPCCHLYIPY